MFQNTIPTKWDQVNKKTQKFWLDLRKKENNHLFAKHPIFAQFGHLMSDSYRNHCYTKFQKTFHKFYSKIHGDEITFDATSPFGISNNKIDSGILFKMNEKLYYASMAEQESHDDIQRLAIELVSDVWNFDSNRLNSKLTQNPEDMNSSQDDDYYQGIEKINEQYPLTEELRLEVNKRLTMNALAHGAAVHMMLSMHHMIKDKLIDIDSFLVHYCDLLPLYAMGFYWQENFDIEESRAQEMLLNATAGTSKVDFDNKNGPSVEAKAAAFPVLVHELVKGIVEILSAWQFSGMDDEMQKAVMYHADNIVYEPWLIQAGPDLWRRITDQLSVDDNIQEAITGLALCDAKDLNLQLCYLFENVNDFDSSIFKINE